MTIQSLFFLLAKPFIYHISGILLVVLMFNLIYLIICFFWRDKLKNKKILNTIIITGTVLLGFYLRVNLAYFTLGNYDVNSYEIVAKLISQGKNVYASTHRYNYSPFWFIILFVLYKINALFFSFPFRFIIGFFLSLIDLVSLFVLFKISKLKKIFFPKIAVGFFLNPINIIIASHHRQFENLAIFFLLLGIYVFLKNKKNKLSGILFLLAGTIKHIIFNQVLVFFNFCFKKRKKIFFYFGASVLFFLATFSPFWKEGKEGIIKNVFLYKSQEGGYGISYFLNLISLGSSLTKYYSYIFILSLFLFAFKFKTKSLIKAVLINNLFFLSFTSGMADQYLVLPLAAGSLANSYWFNIYTLFASFYLFQSPAQLGLKQYGFVSANIVWLVIFIWFIIEYFKSDEAKS